MNAYWKKPKIYFQSVAKVARSKGAVLEHDELCACYRAATRDGHIWEAEGLHELVEPYIEDCWKQDALTALLERMESDKVIECKSPQCDVCGRGFIQFTYNGIDFEPITFEEARIKMTGCYEVDSIESILRQLLDGDINQIRTLSGWIEEV